MWICMKTQGSKGIRQWPINWPNNDTKNYPRLQPVVDTQLNQPTNQNSILKPEYVKPTNKKTLL